MNKIHHTSMEPQCHQTLGLTAEQGQVLVKSFM